MTTLDRSTMYAFRAALVAVLRMVEAMLELSEDERLLKEPKRRKFGA